jgi:hypothetical protein
LERRWRLFNRLFMPIKINLLAEAQIAEDLRRSDPVKRAIFIGALLVALALVWSSSLQLEAMIAKSELIPERMNINTLWSARDESPRPIKNWTRSAN